MSDPIRMKRKDSAEIIVECLDATGAPEDLRGGTVTYYLYTGSRRTRQLLDPPIPGAIEPDTGLFALVTIPGDKVDIAGRLYGEAVIQLNDGRRKTVGCAVYVE